MKNHPLRPLALLHILPLVMLLLGGCAEDRPRMLRLHDDLIEDGKTTIQEVVQHLGVPTARQKGSDGTVASYYADAASELLPEGKRMRGFSAEPGTFRFKSVSVLSGKDQVVRTHWEYVSSQPIKGRLPEGGPLFHFGPVLDPTAAGWIRHGETKEKDLIARFGDPTLEFMAPDQTLTFIWIEGGFTSSISRKPNYRALSVALDDRDVVVQHAIMETDQLSAAMFGLVLR